ncbi:MAG: hypothetical protein ABIE23_04135 [archaeon]|nr:hypothetical protein [Candidatus Micrarchaeota archaeon]
MKSKGYVLTISTLLIVSIILLFSVFYLSKAEKSEKALSELVPIEKAGFVVDDIAFDLNKLLETAVKIERIDSNTRITFNDKLASDLDKENELMDYQNFLYGVYAVQQNAVISIDFNNLVDGKTEMLFSNGLQYDYNYGGSDANVLFYASGGDTNATRMDINVSVNDSSVLLEPWSWDPGGDITVNLFYEDQNALNTVNSSGTLNSSSLHTYAIHFSETVNDVLEVLVGGIEGHNGGFALVEGIDNTSSKANLVFSVTAPSNDVNSLYYYYNADLNYEQLDVNANGLIQIGKG